MAVIFTNFLFCSGTSWLDNGIDAQAVLHFLFFFLNPTHVFSLSLSHKALSSLSLVLVLHEYQTKTQIPTVARRAGPPSAAAPPHR
jgi:hypothetical protein